VQRECTFELKPPLETTGSGGRSGGRIGGRSGKRSGGRRGGSSGGGSDGSSDGSSGGRSGKALGVKIVLKDLPKGEFNLVDRGGDKYVVTSPCAVAQGTTSPALETW
jgi:hypothetical protein